MPEPLFAICIPAYNARSTLAHVLNAAARQRVGGRRPQIYVLDDGSTDDTAELIGQSTAQLLSHDRCLGLARARNTLIEKVGAQFLVFLDADAAPEPGCVQSLLDAFEDDVGAVGGMGIEHYQDRLADRYRAQVTPQSHGDQPLEDRHLMGLCLAVRRCAALEIGGFDEAFANAGEDIDFSLRLRQAGWKLRYEPEARVDHLRSGSVGDLLRQSTRHAYWASRALSAIDRRELSAYALGTVRHLSTRTVHDLRAGRIGMAGLGALVLPARLASIVAGTLAGMPLRTQARCASKHEDD
ncbi:MAG: glycosyltransferase [Candidatus Alcyoniella australis]|nr:glycosyltransferase [Candidatus Alcyoniella australis]